MGGKKSKRRFGGALEPMTYVRAVYDDRERQELVRLDSCEVIESPMSGEVTYARATALAHVAELLDQLMPDREASDAVFRLTLAVLAELRGSALWMPVTYFELWMTRLMGFLPEFGECVVCGRALDGTRAYWHALADGLVCGDDRGLRRRRCRRNRARLRRRCCGHGHRNLLGLNGQRFCARICGSSWCRFWSGILRRRL